MVPFYLFSQKELAPMEDQGVVFGYVQAAADSTLDQTKLFAEKIHDVYASFPEHDSIFQRLARALTKIGCHRMGSVAQQCNTPHAPMFQRLEIIDIVA